MRRRRIIAVIKKRTKNQKVTKYRRYSFFNVGTLLFGTVFIYMIVCVILYLTDTHITSYEVVTGTLSGNYRYDALALRTETVVNASQSGSVQYYAREGSKASAGSTVCSIDNTGAAQTVSYDNFSLDSEDEQRLQDIISSFTINFSDENFQKTYDLKSSVEGTLSEIAASLSGDSASILNQCNAPESGFVLYSVDGLESLTEEEIDSDLFDLNSYESQNLRSNSQVSTGDPIYKLVTKEEWFLYFPLDQTLATELSDTSTIRFRFLKDNQTFSSSFELVENNGEYFGKITMDSSLVRYATDRYLEIELILNRRSGLKIPTSAIVSKEFYQIPEEYVIVNEGTTSEITLHVEHFSADGSSSSEYVTANVYSYEDGVYLVNKSLLSDGDNILMEGSERSYQIQDENLVTLHGVYNINKGYAVFREVTVIDENEEYCIVESNNPYGLAAHDYIVLNASEVDVDEIVY